MQIDWIFTPLFVTGLASAVAAIFSMISSRKSAQNSESSIQISKTMEDLAKQNIRLAQHKLLLDMMERYVELSRQPHYRPSMLFVEDNAKLGPMLLADAATVDVPANKRGHLRAILRSVRPESTWLAETSAKKTLSGEDFDAVRKAINDICNMLEVITVPYRLGLVDKAEYLKEFKNALCSDGKPAFSTYTAKATYFESIKELQKDAAKG